MALAAPDRNFLRKGRLCTACSNLIDASHGVKIWNLAVVSLKPEACHVCAISRFYLDNDDFYRRARLKLGDVDDKVKSKYEYHPPVNGFPGFLVISFKPLQIRPNIFVCFAKDILGRITTRDFERNHDCPQTWHLSRKWLDRCVGAHTHCSFRTDETWYPTRLLDVGEPTAVNSQIKVVATASLPMPGGQPRYMTLSHCWGDTESVSLTISTLADLQNGIVVSTLPKTFRDAIHVTRLLSVRYLWIDRLCIIQDSSVEWRHEAALMEKVYRNSFCNIAALDARSDSEGFLGDRNPLAVEPFTVQLKTNGAQNTQLYAAYGPLELKDHRLTQRGWCCQEMLLAPRLLCFSRAQISWECREHHATEVFPNGTECVASKASDFRLKTLLAKPDAQDSESAMTAWRSILIQYSLTELSRPEDKLYAISGIARTIQARIGSYVCGLWSHYLPIELLWEADSFAPLCPNVRPTSYRAPTWSWASLDRGVYNFLNYKLDTYKHWATIVNVSVTTVDNDPFSQVVSGFIQIRSKLQPAKWRASLSAKQKRMSLNGGKPLIDLMLGLGDDMWFNNSMSLDEDFTVTSAPVDVILLPVLEDISTPDLRREPKIRGLILHRTSEDTYRRLGVFYVVPLCERLFQSRAEATVKII